MTDEERAEWVVKLSRRLGVDFQEKVTRGRKEHGSDLGVVPHILLATEARSEALDQLAYISEMERRFNILLDYAVTLEKQLGKQ